MSSSTEIGFGKAGFSTGEDRVSLHNVSWLTYEQLLADLADQSAPRLTYDRGILEIMSPGPQHERMTDLIETMIKCLAEEEDLDVYCLRSTTFKNKSMERGFEPDSCFFIQNETLIRGKTFGDLDSMPAPDLVIEIDISSKSIDKFPIYAQMKISEIWQYCDETLHFFKLSGKSYVKSSKSLSFPKVSNVSATEFLKQGKDLPSRQYLKSLRQWIKEQ